MINDPFKKFICFILLLLLMKLSELYPEMFSSRNEDGAMPDLPSYYGGKKFWEYFHKEETWFDDSNMFEDPFEDLPSDDPEVYPLKKSNSHEILGVDLDASKSEIKRAYREKVLETHPDKGGSHEEFIKVQEAYECLIS